MKKWFLTFIVLITIIISGYIYYNNHPSGEERAYKKVQEMVLEKVKYPDNLKFIGKNQIGDDDKQYTFLGEATSKDKIGNEVNITYFVQLQEIKYDEYNIKYFEVIEK